MPKPKYTVLFFIISSLVFVIPLILVNNGPEWCDYSSKGQIGDVIGGTTTPFIAIGAAYLTFLAFWVQYEYNKKQRHDVAIERFEHILFEMISSQESITNALVLELLDTEGITSSKSFEDSVIFRQKGRDSFQCVYELYPIEVKVHDGHKDVIKDVEYQGLRDLFKNEKESMNIYSRNPIVGMYDHYFRHLYWIFKFIKEEERFSEDEKYKYACIVRSSLSQYELVLLYYNGLSKGQKKFKPIIEDFSLLNNLRLELLATKEERNLYASKISPTYTYEMDDNKPDTEYKKSAFVRKKS